MDLISAFTNVMDRLSNVADAARMTAGTNAMSPERLAEARRLILDTPADPAVSRPSNVGAAATTKAQAA